MAQQRSVKETRDSPFQHFDEGIAYLGAKNARGKVDSLVWVTKA